MGSTLDKYRGEMERLAEGMGLDFFPVEFEVVPPSFMMEVAVYGLPVRMPHWSFGVRYIHQFVQHRMGHSRIFEIVFPGNPGRAYLANNNSLIENVLVCAHVLGHADFAKNNELFVRTLRQVGHRIVELAAAHAQRIDSAIEAHGQHRVEAVLDASLALEQYVDVNLELNRRSFPDVLAQDQGRTAHAFQDRFDGLPGEGRTGPGRDHELRRPPIPPRPESDLLWFMARYAPEMEDWERDIFLAVREESFYFYPVFACQVMNEGWASYWHARLLREASFLPNDMYVDAIKTHSDVVRPVADENQVALAINPYHLGFAIWDRVVEQHGVARARQIMREEDDFGFLRNYLDAEMANELGLFVYEEKRNGEIKVIDRSIDRVREAILAPKFNYGTPRVRAADLKRDGTLVLQHEYDVDGRGLDTERSRRVLEYIVKVWRRPVVLMTADAKGAAVELKIEPTEY